MEILVLIALMFLNGFFALSEIALVSSKASRLEQEKRKGSRGASTALKLLEESEGFLSAIQVGITLIGIVTGVFGGTSIASDVAPFFEQFPAVAPYASQIALTLTIIAITYLSIVIGELVPKTIAMSNPEAISIRVAPVIFYFSKGFYPFVWLLSASTNFINGLIGIKKRTDLLTESELRQMIKMASTSGVIEQEQNTIHENVFYFSDKKARHLMTPRVDVEWVDLEWTSEEVAEQAATFVHSKILCCEGSLDEFRGLMNLRDYYKARLLGGLADLNTLMTPPVVVPVHAEAQDVLDQLREKKTHLACVVNEYGGLEGIITLHDILENIVGHIPNEGEAFEPDYFVREDKSVLMNGDAAIEKLPEVIEGFSIDFEEIEYSTVAGFVFQEMGRLPRVGDHFDFLGYRIEVMDLDGNRVDKVLISKIVKAEPEG